MERTWGEVLAAGLCSRLSSGLRPRGRHLPRICGATGRALAYDGVANAISIAITDAPHADSGDEVHPRAIVALAGGKPVEVQLLYPDMGISEPLAAVADRYELDLQALHAAAQSALAAPDRVVVLQIAARTPA